MLLFFISGPSVDDVKNLRTIVFVVALLAVVAFSLLLYTSSGVFTLGETGIPEEAAAGGPELDEEEVMLEEYLGLSEEAAEQDVGEPDAVARRVEAPGRARHCHQCGSRLLKAAQFCHNCGAPVAKPPSPADEGGGAAADEEVEGQP